MPLAGRNRQEARAVLHQLLCLLNYGEEISGKDEKLLRLAYRHVSNAMALPKKQKGDPSEPPPK